ncbi:MAG: hypothetical protein ACYC9Y_04420 [Candidatus Methylomirabilia bacterium]
MTILEPLVGRTGWLFCTQVTLSTVESEDHLLFFGCMDDGDQLDEAQCRRFFDLPGVVKSSCLIPEIVTATISEARSRRQKELLEELSTRSGHWFDLEMDKLDRWAEDRRNSLKVALNDFDENLKVAKKAASHAPTLPEKLERQREARVLEAKRDEAWREFDLASREIDRRKDSLLDEVGRRLEQKTEQQPLFAVRWRLV